MRGLNLTGTAAQRAAAAAAASTPRTVAGGAAGADTAQPAMVDAAALDAIIEDRAIQIAQQIVANQATAVQVAGSGRIFTPFNLATDIVPDQKTLVTSGLFSDSSASINTLFTSSNQSSTSKQYYYAAYKDNPAVESNATSQFSVAYGHRLGSGSYSAGQLNDSATKAVYSQYKQLLLNPGDTTFTFGNGESDLIYVVNFDRARLRDRLDPGNWEFSIAQLSGSFYSNNVHTGSNVKVANPNPKIFRLIDDSGDTDQSIGLGAAGRVYNIISGTLNEGGYLVNNDYVYYGLAYPDMGMLVLDGNMLNASASFNTVTGSSVAGDNAFKLFTAISGAMSHDSNFSFQARNEEVVNSTHYFVRVKNGEYNFSNNPSFTTGSVGEFSQPTFINDPKVYITTIGMYNDSQELLAVAKLSQPVQKSFQNEALIKVKLDF